VVSHQGAVKAGHQAARTIFRRAGRYLSLGLYNVIHLFDPALIILSGERMRYDYLYADEMQALTLLQNRTPCRIEIHAWGDLARASWPGQAGADGGHRSGTGGVGLIGTVGGGDGLHPSYAAGPAWRLVAFWGASFARRALGPAGRTRSDRTDPTGRGI